ncbi:MAG: FGGY family carbohydrate kinase [Armatimonadota bacterium]
MAYLTFDIGTTALKTALIDEDGAVLALAEVEYAPKAPRPGWMEESPETYWEAAASGTRMVLEEARMPGHAVEAIGLSSQGESFVALDEAGEPLTPVIVWLDGRAREFAERRQREGLTAEQFRAITGYPWIVHELTVFKIGWLAEHQPEAHRAAKFLCLPDYLIFRMTGEFATDFNIAQMGGLLDVGRGEWSAEMLEAAGINASQLPSIHVPGTPVGEVSVEAASFLGVKAGTTVCAGCNDQLAGAIGAGNVRPGVVSETTGTALAVVATTEERVDSDQFFAGRHAADGAWYSMPYAAISAIVLTWFRDLCGAEDWDELLAGIDEIPPGADGLTVIPHFSGTPNAPDGRGAILGLTLGHGRAEIARAIMESCACLLRELLEPLVAGSFTPETIRSLGGAARSDAWLQMKADMLQTPVERPACTEAASLGAAMLAGTGGGQFATLEEAAEAWYVPARRFDPQADLAEAYEQVFERYVEQSALLCCDEGN